MLGRPSLFALLLLTASIARGAFPVTAERPIAPMLTYAREAQVVATDSGFLALWKTGAPARVARLSREGDIESRFVVPDLGSKISWYDAASNGETVLLAGSCTGPVLCYARFSAAGEFLDLTSVPVASPIAPVVTSNGRDFLITLSTNGTRDAVAVRVAADGTPGNPIVLGPWDQNTHWTSSAAIGDDWFVTFGSSGEQRKLVRLSESGIAAAVDLTPPLTFWHQMRIGASGDRILVVVPAYESALFAIYDAALAQTVPWTPLDGGNSYPMIAATDSGWLVATGNVGGGATLQPIGRGGERGAVQRVAEGYNELAVNGDRVAIVTMGPADQEWISVRASVFDDRGARVREPATISVAEAAQIEPVGVEGNGVILAAWTELGADERFVVKARAFDAAGEPLGPAVAMPPSEERQTLPAVAFNGESFFVAWSEGRVQGVRGARIGIDGRLLDAEAIPLFEFGSQPYGDVRSAGVAWSGTAWVVASSDDKGLIAVVRISPGGVVLDPTPVRISEPEWWGAGADYAPLIECNGIECLVAWHGIASCPSQRCWTFPLGVLATRISPDLTVLDAVPLELTIPNEEIAEPRRSSIAWNEIAGSWLVTWSFSGGQRISREGRLLDPPATGRRADETVVSAIPERDGWRVLWSTRDGDVFHGWTRTGRASDAQERVALAATAQKETDARLVDAPRPLALFVREDPASPGSPQVIAGVLDESSAPIGTGLTLSATRISAGEVALTWTSDVEGVTAFRIYRWTGLTWQLWQSALPSQRGLTVPLAEGRTVRILLRAEAPSGAVDSNVVEIAGERQRRVTR